MQSVEQGTQPAIDQLNETLGQQVNTNVILCLNTLKSYTCISCSIMFILLCIFFVFMFAFMMIMLSTFFAG